MALWLYQVLWFKSEEVGERAQTDTQDDYLLTLFCPLLKKGKYTENNLWL
jgi:hypothetical protein